MSSQDNFKSKVIELVGNIPPGMVMTYGQIAIICGRPQASRIVGGIAHKGDPRLPWHRIVKKDGRLAEGYPGGIVGHELALKSEGVAIINNRVDMDKYLWHPPIN